MRRCELGSEGVSRCVPVRIDELERWFCKTCLIEAAFGSDLVDTCALFAWDRMPGTLQSLIEMLERAQEGLRGRDGRDSDGSMSSLSDDVPLEHLLALVSGLKGEGGGLSC